MNSLFDAIRERRTIQERFDAFCEQHPDVYDLFKRFSLELLAAGRKRYGSKGICERIRWHYATTSSGHEPYKICNDFTSRLARKLAAEDSRFADFFEFRELKTE